MTKKTKIIEPKIEKDTETYLFSKNEITVRVKIDYNNNEISLLDKHRDFCKQYIFNKRGVEYMQGWLNILSVMQEAIKDAKKRYETELAERSKFSAEDISFFKIKWEKLK